MSFGADKRKRKILIWVTSIVVVLAVIVGACAGYVNDYYRADAVSIAAFAPINTITKEVLDDNTIVYAPENATTGLIFYPGGKVEYTAYAPLMQTCADRGILCVLVEPNLSRTFFTVSKSGISGSCDPGAIRTRNIPLKRAKKRSPLRAFGCP